MPVPAANFSAAEQPVRWAATVAQLPGDGLTVPVYEFGRAALGGV